MRTELVDTRSTLRRFRDAGGVLWDAWSVVPENIERRFEAPAGPPHGVERRHRNERRVSLGPRLAHGWLTFQSRDERRRLAPIPPGWDQLSDADLARLCEHAERVSLRRPP